MIQERKLIPILTNEVPPSLPVNPIQNRWALLVGVDRYGDPSFSRLNFCVKDVLALNTILEQLGYTIACLHDELGPRDPRFPTFSNIEAELTRMCQTVGSDDLLWVHFACHGTLIEKQPVLIAENTRHTTLASTALPLEKIEALMRGSKAKRLVLTLDACHTGVEMGRDLSDSAFIRNAFELAEGFALIAASTAQQVAQEWREAEHGVFTYYLLEGLTGKADYASKGFVSVQDLQTYVVNNLRQWNVRHGGRIQEPTFRADGIGDMIVGDYRQYAKPDSVVPTVSTDSSATVSRRTPEDRSPAAMPSPSEMKRQALQQQYQDLQAEYQEVHTEISFSSGAARLKLERQAETLLQRMMKIDDQLKQL